MSKCWPFLIVAASWFCFQTDSLAGICIPPMYGLDCNYKCHCYTSNCDGVTGCFGGCNKGWHGANCNKENIAFNKHTSQSSYSSGWWKNSSLAVDGSLYQGSGAKYCMFTEPGHQYTWWQVDLDKKYYIHKLAVHFRTSHTYRRNGVKVYSSVRKNPKPTGHLCGSATGSSPDVTSMTCNNTARYITLYQNTYNSRRYWQTGDTAMNFCEVQVFVCAPGTFGDDCNSLCHCRNGPCDYVTGECTGGCQQNWTGIACSECVSDHYGPLCEKSCSSRHCDESSAYSSCSRVTGRCDNGCTAGWMEPDCTEICASGTFGDDCTSFCHCLDGPCDYITGECTGECKQNWTGITCSECDSDLYGPLCAKPCSSRHCDESSANSSCSKVTGRCDNGCTAGWLEQDCTTKCPQDMYGLKCGKYCHLRQCFGHSSCDHVTGKCDHGCDRGYWSDDCRMRCQDTYGFNCNMSCDARHCHGGTSCSMKTGRCTYGCQPGWELPDCTTPCQGGTFGPRCQSKCNERHCKGDNSSCDTKNGTCQHGCQPGWKSPSCNTACDRGSYGVGCQFSCSKRHCKVSTTSCNKVNGSCEGLCRDSWMGVDCTGCDGKYGPDCLLSCDDRHCKHNNAPCDHLTGSCDGECMSGWQGATCSDNCSNMTYGDNCAMLCSDRHCSNTASCHHETGQCVGGCASGWKGTTCSKVESAASTDFPVGSAVGGTVAALVVIAVVMVVIVFVRRRKLNIKDHTEHRPLPEKTENTLEKTHGAAEGPIYANVEPSARISTETLDIDETNISHVVPVVDRGEPAGEQTDEEEEVQDSNTYYNADQPAPLPFNLPEEGFHISELEGIIENIRRQPGEFAAEYLKLPSGFKHPYTDSQIQENRCKNRFAGYYPYNNNRVKLSLLPNIPHSDYINASYVDAYGKPNYFIASQAPNKVTLPDFWRMIWEQDCGQIVMLTNLVEAGKHKCEPYWNDSESMNVGYFYVMVTEINERADYVIRKIEVTQKKSKKCKTFDHYHFTSWPDHGVPKVLDLLEFFWLTRETSPSRPGPVLVHCSAGIGRTGTYIALHILTDEMNKTGSINILDVMTKIRDQRKNMVQTKNQYECIFTSMLEVATYGQTIMTTSTYTQGYDELKGSMSMGRKTLDDLAQVIATTDISDTDLPLKNKLWVGGKDDLFVAQAPSTLLSKGYLLVYTPQRTENLLWKLIMENDALTLVTLGNKNDAFVPGPSHFGNYGNVTVTTVTETHISREITLRILNVEMKDSDEKKEIANFSVQSRSNMSNTSTVISSLTSLTEQILDRQNNLKFHPVTVVFDESDKKEGLSLCILNNIMSGVSLDKRVEIFNNVRRIQSVLPGVHLSVDDFKLFCDLPFAYLDSTGVYANM